MINPSCQENQSDVETTCLDTTKKQRGKLNTRAISSLTVSIETSATMADIQPQEQEGSSKIEDVTISELSDEMICFDLPREKSVDEKN